MISIEGLLEDEQGLSMGEMLTVKIRQPSHEFTFGVGVDAKSAPSAKHTASRTSWLYTRKESQDVPVNFS
jgi:hypothetical protein